MEPGLELDARNDRRVNINEIKARMSRHDVTTASGTPFPVAVVRLVILPEMLFALHDLDLVRVPQGKSVYGPGGPVPAAFTMAIAHSSGLACDFDFNGTAKALTFVRIRHVSRSRVFLMRKHYSTRRRKPENLLRKSHAKALQASLLAAHGCRSLYDM